MQFLLIICHDESFRPTKKLIKEIGTWIKENADRGIRKHGNPLRPSGEATTVRVRSGQVLLTKGPFARSIEKMSAYELIECQSFDEAIEAASTHPMAKAATIEVRPIWDELVN
jgi:hypothetical protein